MSRTIRAYNKAPLQGGPGFRGWFVTEIRREMLENDDGWYSDSLRPDRLDYRYSYCLWVSYHPYRQICMGHCKMCKSKYVETANQRKRREKRYFELEVTNFFDPSTP